MVLRMPDLSAAASCRCACTFEYRPSNAASSPSLYPHLPPSLYSSFPPLLPSTLISHPPSTFPLLSSDHILCGTGVPPPVETASTLISRPLSTLPFLLSFPLPSSPTLPLLSLSSRPITFYAAQACRRQLRLRAVHPPCSLTCRTRVSPKSPPPSDAARSSLIKITRDAMTSRRCCHSHANDCVSSRPPDSSSRRVRCTSSNARTSS